MQRNEGTIDISQKKRITDNTSEEKKVSLSLALFLYINLSLSLYVSSLSLSLSISLYAPFGFVLCVLCSFASRSLDFSLLYRWIHTSKPGEKFELRRLLRLHHLLLSLVVFWKVAIAVFLLCLVPCL